MIGDVLMREDLWEQTWVSPAVPSGKWQDASYVLLAEIHDDEFIKNCNSQLIDQLSTPNSILLVEGMRSLWRPLSFEKTAAALLSLRISEVAMQKIPTVMGWDYFNHLGDQAFYCSFDPPYTIFVGDDERDRPKFREYARVIRSDGPMDLERGMASLLAWGENMATFPKRTDAMVQTLRVVEQRKALDPSIGKVFLVAGKSHVINSSSVGWESLGPLYAELNRLPAAVISIGHPRH